MSAQTTRSQQPGEGRVKDKAPTALRIIGLVAVFLGVAAIAAATFVLSYSGIHALALQARIAPRLARGYPLLVDAMLVIVLAAVLALRGAGLPSRIFSWATLVVVLGAAAAADAQHAAGRKLPDHVAAVTVAVVPWVLVFVAFSLLLAMLRYARIRRQAPARAGAPADMRVLAPPADHANAVPVLVAPSLELPHRPAAAITAGDAGPPAAPVPAEAPAVTQADDEAAEPDAAEPSAAEPTAADADAATAAAAETGAVGSGAADVGEDSPGEQAAEESDLAVLAVPHQSGPAVAAAAELAADDSDLHDFPDLAADADESLDDPASDESSSQEGQPRIALAEESGEPDMPVFHRMWSAPTPPAGM